MAFQGISISTEGVEEVRKMLLQLPEEARKEIVVKSAQAGGDYLFPFIQERVPVDTGLAKSDLQKKIVQPQPGVATANITPGKKGWYIRFFEWGTSKMPAKPIFRPPYDQHGPAAAQKMIDAFIGWLRDATGGVAG